MDLHIVGALMALSAFEKTVHRFGELIDIHIVAFQTEVGLSRQR